jgi:hypothetical protein
MPRSYRTARVVFRTLVALSLLTLFALTFLMPWSAPREEVPPPAVSGGTIALVALLSSLVSIVGLISTNLLAWRKDRRDSRVADIDLEKQALALERERLVLEKQRLDLQRERSQRPDELT